MHIKESRKHNTMNFCVHRKDTRHTNYNIHIHISLMDNYI